MNRLKVARSAVTVSVILGSLWGVPGASAKSAPDGKSQLAFGVDMAKRGLWSEALFRFEQAKLLQPGSVAVLNNLAICYEAGGRFEEALETYRQALELAPANKAVKQNYSRFAEFYQGYRPRKATPTPTGPAPVTETPVAQPATPGAETPAPAAPPAASTGEPPPPPSAAPGATDAPQLDLAAGGGK